MVQKYVYERNGNAKLATIAIHERDSTKKVIVFGEGLIGTVCKSDIFPYLTFCGADVVA